MENEGHLTLSDCKKKKSFKEKYMLFNILKTMKYLITRAYIWESILVPFWRIYNYLTFLNSWTEI